MPELVVAVASSALFDLAESDAVFRDQGTAAYRAWCRAREREPLAPGVAFPFVRRLLSLNALDPARPPVEVVLLSRNDPGTGLRVRTSLDHHQLAVKRSVFTGGRSPWPYLDAFGAQLFLSANAKDVAEATAAGRAAGRVLPGGPGDGGTDDAGDELRVAFDFDGVLADDASERLNQEQGLAAFHAAERAQAEVALEPGPLAGLLKGLARVQERELERENRDGWKRRLIIGIVTARSHPADRRVITTLRAWGVQVDFAAFLGDLAKTRVLGAFRPHLFFDDKPANAASASGVVPSVHVPFGVLNPPAITGG